MLLEEIQNQHVNTTVRTIVALLWRDCKKAVEDFKRCGDGQWLHRGFKHGDKLDNVIFNKAVRTDRRPKDMRKDVHKFIDQYFLEEFGIKARSQTLFCFPANNSHATGYGRPYSIFPQGDYSIIYSLEVVDMYALLDDEEWADYLSAEDSQHLYDDGEVSDDAFYEAIEKWIKDREYRHVETVGDVIRKSVGGSTLATPELMVACKQYYAINPKIMPHVQALLHSSSEAELNNFVKAFASNRT